MRPGRLRPVLHRLRLEPKQGNTQSVPKPVPEHIGDGLFLLVQRMTGIRLIAGLGNPGKEYAATRHNAGFWFLDLIAQRYGVNLRMESRFQAQIAKIKGQTQELWLLAPQAFMNLSGQSVAGVAQYYKIAPQEILVVHDELDLPPGTARLKKGGGHAGHNGLKDIIARMGADFWRLRIGIGHPGDKQAVADFVLQRPNAAETALIHDALAQSEQVLDLIVAGDMSAAMQKLHTSDKAF